MNNLAVKQIMQVHKKGKIVRFMYNAQFITCIQFYVCGWTSITHQKVTSAELGGLTQSGSWHIMNRVKQDARRIPVYSDRDTAS